VLKNGSILAATLITVILALIIVGSSFTGYAAALDVSASPTVGPTVAPTPTVSPSATPAANVTTTPTPSPTLSPSPTPVPTPAQRSVFSSPNWDVDHETIAVTNNGDPISVIAWINSPSDNITYPIGAGASQSISTPTILTQDGQIVNIGFGAYDNGTLIDSYNATITISIGPSPTPLPQENVMITGTITDKNNGTPIAGAIVTFTSMNYGKTYPSVTTDSSGTFTTQMMYPDIYTVQVTAGGYQSVSMVTEKITTSSAVNGITLTPLTGAPTPTPTPSPSPSPSIVDSWTSLISNPQVCIGTLSALVAVIAGTLGIYEWFARQRSARLKKEKEDVSKPGENKDKPEDVKKP